jgi:hypothetical protein
LAVLTNKHVVVALLVAPILSLFAWYAVDSWIGEQAKAAETGRSYPLVAKSNCRYVSGLCELENEEFTLSIRLTDNNQLVLESLYPLEGVMVAVGDPTLELMPAAMSAGNSTGTAWQLGLSHRPAVDERIQLVAQAGGSQFFGDVATLFIERGDADRMQLSR